jgi:hypothetical protein
MSFSLNNIHPQGRNPAAGSRGEKQQTAKRIVRKRFRGKKAIDHIYRKPTPGAYRNCAFLENHSAAIAVDTYGFLDIVQLQPRRVEQEPEDDEEQGHGAKLLSSLRLRSSPVNSWDAQPSYGLKSYNSGHSFAVGMESGDLHLYDTEYASRKNIQATTTNWLKHKGRTNTLTELSTSQTATPNTTTGESIVTNGWRARRPLRRYQSDRLENCVSLRQELQNPSLASTMHEIYQWNQLDSLQPIISAAPPCQWDFWEGSSLRALHVGGRDCFGVTVADTRQRASQNAICFDTSSKSVCDRFDAACFLSEFTVATCTTTTRSRGGSDNLLALWDLRKTQTCCSQVILPSFPLDFAFGMTKSSSFRINKSVAPSSLLQVTQLTRLQDKVMVSFKKTVTDVQCSREHVIVDPIRECVLGRLQQVANESKDGSLPPFAVSEASNVMASYEQSEENHRISFQCLDDVQEQSKRGQKRRVSGDPSTDGMDIELTDRWGTSTDLNSLAFNRDGSCIVGTSRDGDLFSWRA